MGVVSTVLSSDSSWADPVVVQVNAALEHNVDHLLSTDVLLLNLNASSLPSLKHLVLTLPLSSKHDTVVGDFIQVMDVLKAEVNSLMHSALLTIVKVLMVSIKLGIHVVSTR